MNDVFSSFSRVAVEMQQKMEGEIRAVQDTKEPGLTFESMLQRCRIVEVPGSNIRKLCLDGVPLLELHPILMEEYRDGDCYRIMVTADFRRLR